MALALMIMILNAQIISDNSDQHVHLIMPVNDKCNISLSLAPALVV